MIYQSIMFLMWDKWVSILLHVTINENYIPYANEINVIALFMILTDIKAL